LLGFDFDLTGSHGASGLDLSRTESDFFSDRFRNRLQGAAVVGKNAAMFGQDAAMVEEDRFDASETFRAPSLELGHLALEGRLVFHELCLGPNQRGHRLVKFIEFSIPIAACPSHPETPEALLPL
jgi:hypothetical protein